jgi:hypothetical protein
VGDGKVVHVHPDVRRGHGFSPFAEQRFHGCMPAKPRRSEYEQVVAALLHLGAEPDCSERTFLANQAGQGLKTGCRREAEARNIRASAKLARFKRCNG